MIFHWWQSEGKRSRRYSAEKWKRRGRLAASLLLRVGLLAVSAHSRLVGLLLIRLVRVLRSLNTILQQNVLTHLLCQLHPGREPLPASPSRFSSTTRPSRSWAPPALAPSPRSHCSETNTFHFEHEKLPTNEPYSCFCKSSQPAPPSSCPR